MMLLGILAAAAVETSQPVPVSADANVRNGRQSVKALEGGDKLICRREASTGSMFAKKTCRSAKEMEERRVEERQNIDLNQRVSSKG